MKKKRRRYDMLLKRHPIMLRIPEPWASRIDKLARAQKASLNNVVTKIVVTYFEEVDRDKRNLDT